MKSTLLFTGLILSIFSSAWGQVTRRSLGNHTVFTMPFEGDSVTFAVAVPIDKLTRKPIFLFRQGSMPWPLFTLKAKSGQTDFTELPPIVNQYKADYNFIMIAKPGVPLVVNEAYIDKLFETRSNPDPVQYPRTYLAHNYLDFYVRQTNAVLAYVLKQPWVDARRVVVTGGSEGYNVAIKTAATNRAVTHLIAFSGNLEGRHQALIRRERGRAFSGEITQEEAQRNVEDLQQQWTKICRDSLNTDGSSGDPNRTMYSFSHGQNTAYLLSLSIPILIIYGTADVGSTSNDILPLEFARRGKTNLTVKAYPNHDHYFYKYTYGPNGKEIRKEYNGEAIQRDYFEWLKER